MKRRIISVILWCVTICCILYGVNRYCLNGNGGITFDWKDKGLSFDFGDKGGIAGEGTEQTYEFINDFKNLEIDCDMADIEIVTGDKASCSYIVPEGESYKIDWKNDNGGTACITQAVSGWGDHKSAKFTLVLPQNTALEKVDAEVDMGNLDIKGLTIKYIDADLDMGDCTLTDVNFGSLDGTLSMGNCVINGIDSQSFGWDLTTDMGDITIDGKSMKSDCEKDNGDSEKKMDVDVDMGDITIN